MSSLPVLARVAQLFADGPCDKVIVLDDGTEQACGLVHTRCRGHARSTDNRSDDPDRRRKGDPCCRQAIAGAVVCPSHGAGAPQAKVKAQERVVEARALGEVGKLHADGLAAMEGLTGVEQMILRIDSAGARAFGFEQLLNALPERSQWSYTTNVDDKGAMQRFVLIEEEGRVGPDDKGNIKLHVYEEGLRYWSAEHARLLKIAADIGIEERRLQLRTDQVRLVTSVIRHVVAGLGHDLDDPAVVPVVSAALQGMSPAALLTT
jgi:hypothetical protein